MNWLPVSADLTSFIVMILCFLKINTCVSPVPVTLEALFHKIRNCI